MECKKESQMVTGIGQEVKLGMEELETIIRDTLNGFALIDVEENESYYENGRNLENLFKIINKNTVKNISYIQSELTVRKIKRIQIKLINNELITLESL